MTKTYPDDCIQALVGAEAWWQPNLDHHIRRGALITAFVPYIDQTPYMFAPIGRTQATEHQLADVMVTPLRVEQPLKQVDLPVAAMPLHSGEVWGAYRAKRRPCLVLSADAPAVDKALTRGMPNRASAPTMVVAPYYGADKHARAGYNTAFVQRIQRCEFPQFLWDIVPLAGADESILRLDQMQPIGRHHQSYKVHDVRLSEGGMEIVDGMIDWLMRGGIPKDHPILMFQELIRTL